MPTRTDIDARLVGGAAGRRGGGAVLFGPGRGISGFCAGPARAGLPLFAPGTLVFPMAMLIAMWLASGHRQI